MGGQQHYLPKQYPQSHPLVDRDGAPIMEFKDPAANRLLNGMSNNFNAYPFQLPMNPVPMHQLSEDQGLVSEDKDPLALTDTEYADLGEEGDDEYNDIISLCSAVMQD
jgi:hypothetical protein